MAFLYDLLSFAAFGLVLFLAVRFFMSRVRKVDADLKARQAMNEAVYLQAVRSQYAAPSPQEPPKA